VKRASLAVKNITIENVNYYELRHRSNALERSLEGWSQYFEKCSEKLQVMAKYFKEKENADKEE